MSGWRARPDRWRDNLSRHKPDDSITRNVHSKHQSLAEPGRGEGTASQAGTHTANQVG